MPIPSVTFVIPCFNHGRFVQAAVESCLAQECDARVVVVDDGSSDRATPAACDRCIGDRVTVIHQSNRGLPAARNRGAAGASTDYLVFLDADDWLEPHFVSRLHAAIQSARAAGSGDDVSHAFCQERLVELGTGVWRVPEWDPLLLMITNLHPVTTLVRRECFEAVGGFTESMREGYEDWDFWLKFVEKGWRGVRVREPLFVWRRHSHSTMVMRVIHHHVTLYRRIVEQHKCLYEKHRDELLVRTNVMLRQYDMNWLDETGYPINLRALRRVREMYESMTAVRMHHALHRVINAMPRPVAAGAKKVLAATKRILPAPRGAGG